MKKKVLWVCSVVMAAVLVACAGGKDETAVDSTESKRVVTSESVADKITDEVDEDKEEDKHDSTPEDLAIGEEISTDVYHNQDLAVKYSDDGKITLCYQDQEIDITNSFGKVDVNDEIGGYDCRVYLLDKDGKGVYVTVKYKYGCAALDDFLINNWTEEYHNYADGDISAINDYHVSEGSVYTDSTSDAWDIGSFYLSENGQTMIVPAEVADNDLGTNSVMVQKEGAEELSFETTESVDIWLYEPVQGAYGAVVTGDAFLDLLKQNRIDCRYHLNDAGKIDVIRGIYFS